MRWYSSLYVDPDLKQAPAQIKKQIEGGRFPGGVRLVSLAVHPKNLLECFDADELKYPFVRERIPMIVGLAAGREGAKRLVCRILEDVSARTGGLDVRDYFIHGQRG